MKVSCLQRSAEDSLCMKHLGNSWLAWRWENVVMQLGLGAYLLHPLDPLISLHWVRCLVRVHTLVPMCVGDASEGLLKLYF